MLSDKKNEEQGALLLAGLLGAVLGPILESVNQLLRGL